MTTYVLVHGAWHGPWCWDLLRAQLEERGAWTVAVDLSSHDPGVHYGDMVSVVAGAVRATDDDVIVVGHSFGGVVVPPAVALEADRVRSMVLLCALLPVPGRSLGDQVAAEPDIFTPEMAKQRVDRLDGTSTWPEDRAVELFYQDVPEETARWAAARGRAHANTVRDEPCPMTAWPDVVTHYVVCGDDQVVNPAWSRRAVPDRLGVVPTELPGGHSPFLSRPEALAALLLEVTATC